jgi:hypothetical protein
LVSSGRSASVGGARSPGTNSSTLWNLCAPQMIESSATCGRSLA